MRDRKKRIYAVVGITLIILALVYVIFLRDRASNNNATNTGLSLEQQTAEAEKYIKDKTNSINTYAQDIKNPQQLIDLKEDTATKISIASEIALNLLTNNKPEQTYTFLQALDTPEFRKYYDYMFYYYISARDGKNTEATDLRQSVLDILKRDNPEFDVSTLGEDYFSITPVKASSEPRQ